MGKAAAGNAAAACRISFPGIELALIVGICGGIPRYGDSDIFLGDVIISTGVKQFDFGRRFPDRFEKRLQTNAKLYLEEQAARYPGADNDRLFASEYRHKHQDPSECDICAACTASSHPFEPVNNSRFIHQFILGRSPQEIS
ncbi:hypothetical protein LMH87_006167 [Akanthomyces muscarius]|uniref:Nucleoside phosphorylase domain-containing protein n=1 Tax=Akanthomyces muscarius TaxID=2231603 RepID=A0A9W8QQ97_AKAMU|nr:hypothetical protein LMH87_006167 [Akanthomyces muscarius]KAJ4164494.1 hypothetical protein LMH87_006167 [Akanthomyces muscarius]